MFLILLCFIINSQRPQFLHITKNLSLTYNATGRKLTFISQLIRFDFTIGLTVLVFQKYVHYMICTNEIISAHLHIEYTWQCIKRFQKKGTYVSYCIYLKRGLYYCSDCQPYKECKRSSESSGYLKWKKWQFCIYLFL